MIFYYSIADGLGNTLRALVNCPNREIADLTIAGQIEKAARKGFVFELANASVTDVTSDPVLSAEIDDHELGEARPL